MHWDISEIKSLDFLMTAIKYFGPMVQKPQQQLVLALVFLHGFEDHDIRDKVTVNDFISDPYPGHCRGERKGTPS